jgi:hypothetical protein
MSGDSKEDEKKAGTRSLAVPAEPAVGTYVGAPHAPSHALVNRGARGDRKWLSSFWWQRAATTERTRRAWKRWRRSRPDHTHLTAAGFARSSVVDAAVAQDSVRRRLSSASRQQRLQNEHEHGSGAGGLGGGEEEDRGGSEGDPITLSCLPAESIGRAQGLRLQRPRACRFALSSIRNSTRRRRTVLQGHSARPSLLRRRIQSARSSSQPGASSSAVTAARHSTQIHSALSHRLSRRRSRSLVNQQASNQRGGIVAAAAQGTSRVHAPPTRRSGADQHRPT